MRWIASIIVLLAAALVQRSAAFAQDTATPIQLVVTVILVPATATDTPTATPTLVPTDGPSPTPTATYTPTFVSVLGYPPTGDGAIGGEVILQATAGDIMIALLLMVLIMLTLGAFMFRLRGR